MKREVISDVGAFLSLYVTVFAATSSLFIVMLFSLDLGNSKQMYCVVNNFNDLISRSLANNTFTTDNIEFSLVLGVLVGWCFAYN